MTCLGSHHEPTANGIHTQVISCLCPVSAWRLHRHSHMESLWTWRLENEEGLTAKMSFGTQGESSCASELPVSYQWHGSDKYLPHWVMITQQSNRTKNTFLSDTESYVILKNRGKQKEQCEQKTEECKAYLGTYSGQSACPLCSVSAPDRSGQGLFCMLAPWVISTQGLALSQLW